MQSGCPIYDATEPSCFVGVNSFCYFPVRGEFFLLNRMPWTGEQRAYAVETLLVTGSTRTALRALRRQWGSRHLPTRRTLERWARDFRSGQLPGQAPPRAHHPRVDPAVLRSI